MRNAIRAITLSACLAINAAGQSPVTPSAITFVTGHTLPAGGVGGLYFDPLGATLYVGNACSGAIQSHPILRNPATGRITGFGAPTIVTLGNSPEGLDNLGGTWIWTNWPGNTLGQFSPSTGAAALANLTLAGVPSSTGGLRVVPPGLPNAGTVLVSSYDNGNIYQVPVNPTPGGTGTYQVPANSATVFATTPIGAEGIAFIPSGPHAGSILHSNYDNGDVTLIYLDASGTPTGQQSTLITNIPLAMAVAFDPLNGDLFVSNWNGANNVYHFSGTIRGDYQPNQPGASLDIGGLQGSLLAAAVTVAPAGTPLIANMASTNGGLPFDIALAPSVIPAGLVGPQGQIVNVSIATPSWLFGGAFVNSFTPTSLTFGAPGSPIAGQMGVVDPTKAIGLAISQPNFIQ